MGPPGMATPGGQALSTGTYEFGPADDAIIRKAGSRARIWGIISLVGGVLTLGGGVVLIALAAGLPAPFNTIGPGIGAGLLPLAIANLVGAFFYFQSGQSLEAVVNTQGNDIEHMMQGLNKLAKAFMIEAILTIIAIVAGLGLGVAIAGSGLGT